MVSKLFHSNLDEGEQGVALRETKEPSSKVTRIFQRPLSQVILLGFICFACPGLFNALSSLGGAGQVSTTLASNSLTALYSTFAVGSFFAGTFINVLGVKKSLFIGSLGYVLYVASLLTYNIKKDQVSAFVIASGAILGLGAALLWTAQATVMLSLPAEDEKGRFISIFWILFNMGDVIGSAILLGENHEHDTAGSLSTAGYSIFVGLTALGSSLAFLLVSPRKITRSDGTRVITPIHPSWKSEMWGLVRCLKNDPMILLCFPFFAVSNIFYVYHFNALNAGLFSLRSRSLNSLLYWLAQILAAPIVGAFLDSPRFSRRTRAFSGWAMLLVLIQVVWGCSYLVQKTFSRENVRTLDFGSEGGSTNRAYYGGVTVLYIFCGFSDAAWQILALYIIGSLSNSPKKLAYYSGFYKGLQSALNAVFWHLDATSMPFMKLLIIIWCLLSASLVIILPMILFRIRNHTTTDVRIVETEAELDVETYATIDDNRSLRGDAAGYDSKDYDNMNQAYRRKIGVERLPTLEEGLENQVLSSHSNSKLNRDDSPEEEKGGLLEMKNLSPSHSVEEKGTEREELVEDRTKML